MSATATRLAPSPTRVLAAELPGHVGERVMLQGSCAAIRRAKAIRFVVIRDRSGEVQVVARGDDTVAMLDDLPLHSAVRVLGTVREGSVPRYGVIEVELEAVEVVAAAHAPSTTGGPAGPSARFLTLRGRPHQLVFELQTTLEAAIREFLIRRGFVELHTPKISAGGSESGATVFELPYFGETACLVQSPQFYMQLAMAAGFERAFEIGPVFRAETGVTNRHAAEFTSIDVELAWIESEDEAMALAEDLLIHALTVVRDAHGLDVERHFGVPVDVPAAPLPRYPLSSVETADDGNRTRLTHEAEQLISKRAHEQYGHSFVFVTGYAASDRPFYTMHDGTASRSFDLLWRGIEVASGCQREHRYEVLRAQVAEAGLHSDALARYLDAHYLEMFRSGCPPHGGFGIGLNRLLMALLGQPSIEDTTFVFRGPGRCVP